jgi:hypothetical protein
LAVDACDAGALKQYAGTRPNNIPLDRGNTKDFLRRKGDVSAVLCGCSNPAVLRKTGDYHPHVGVCYVSEYMNSGKRSSLNTASFEARKVEIR